MHTSRVLLSALLLFGILLHPRSAASIGGQFGLEFAIDAPWRIEPVPLPHEGNTYGPIPITITFHDAIYDHHRSSVGQLFANLFGSITLQKRHVGIVQYIDVIESRQKGAQTFLRKPRLARGNLREIERKRWISTKSLEPVHELCRPHLGQNCESFNGQNLYDITDSHEWHAMFWYTPQDVTSGENIKLIIKVVTKYDGKERHWINAVVVHAGEAPLPRFNNQWLYGDLHYHSQMTDNEGESGYSYRNVVRTLGALGMDFAFSTDHASDSSQTALTDLTVVRCGSLNGKECPGGLYGPDGNTPQSCQDNGQTLQCQAFSGDEARDLNQTRFTYAKNILYGPDGANQAIGRDFETNGFARFRSAGLVPQIYMGEEIDERPEMSQGEYNSGLLRYGDSLLYPWSNASQCLAKTPVFFCGPDASIACTSKSIQQLCRENFSIVQPSPNRYFIQDIQGAGDSLHHALVGVAYEPEPSRQHMVYFPSSGASDGTGFVSGQSRKFGGADRTLDQVIPEIEARGVTFLAHPLSEHKPGGKGPDLLPYSELALDRAWSSRAVLGLQFWNENARFTSQIDNSQLPAPYSKDPFRFLVKGYASVGNLDLQNAQVMLESANLEFYGWRDQIQQRLPEINRLRFIRSRVWESLLPDGGKAYTATRPFLLPSQPLFFGGISDQDITKPWSWRAQASTQGYSRLYQSAFTWDRYLRKGLDPAATSNLASWLPSGEPRKWFMAGGSDAHGDFNYRRAGYICQSEWCEEEEVTDTAIGNPRNLVLVGAPMGAPLPNVSGSVQPFTNTQVIDALKAGRFSVTDGPALRIAIDRNRNGLFDDADFPMGSTFNLFPGEQVPLLIEWISTEEFGPIKKIDIYLGTKDSTLASPNHGASHTACVNSEFGARTFNITSNEQRTYDPAHPGQYFLKPGGIVEDTKTGKEYSTPCEESSYAYWINAVQGQQELLQINLANDAFDSMPVRYHGMAKVYLNPVALNLSTDNGKLFYIRAYAQTYGRTEAVLVGANKFSACTDSQGNQLASLAPGKCGDRHAYTNPIWGRYIASCQLPISQQGLDLARNGIDSNGDGFPDTCKAPVIDQCTGALPASGSSLRSCKFVEALPCLASSKGCGSTEAAAHLLLMK